MANEIDPNVYENLEEAQFRLTNTVVGYDGWPAYIHEVQRHRDGIFRLLITRLPFDDNQPDASGDDFNGDELPAGQRIRKRIDSPKFNRFRPLPLGFMNYFDDGRVTGREIRHASYSVRVPVRRSKQGLDSGAFQATSLVGGVRVALNNAMRSHAFAEMTRGVYPTFDEAMERLAPGSSIAVDRHFAIRQGEIGFNYLVHKTEEVGLVHRNSVLLLPDYMFLREAIIENAHLPNNVGEY